MHVVLSKKVRKWLSDRSKSHVMAARIGKHVVLVSKFYTLNLIRQLLIIKNGNKELHIFVIFQGFVVYSMFLENSKFYAVGVYYCKNTHFLLYSPLWIEWYQMNAHYELKFLNNL